jgi:hypothetical protein
MEMKFVKFFFVVICVGLATAGSASAENSLRSGAKALSFGLTDRDITVSGRLLPTGDIALLVGLGFSHTENDANATSYSLSTGARKYLAKSDLAPFVGATISYRRDEQIIGTDVQTDKTFALNGHFGLEYFFVKQVSAEAQVGLELSTHSDAVDTTTIGTFRSGVTVNFYFP